MPNTRRQEPLPTAATPERLRDLARVTRDAILRLPGVTEPARSLRIGKKVFVRFSVDSKRVFLELKLPPQEAKRATALAFVRPMEFGGMGRHGWVEVALTRKSELADVLRLVRASRGLYASS